MRLRTSKAPRGRKVRGAAAAAMAVAGLTGLALAQTSPAQADPTQTLVAVGSDTIQDVYNQFALDAAGNLLGSYNATNPVTGAAHETITPADGSGSVSCSFARPNGSGEGVADLRLAISPSSTNATAAPAPVAQQGCVDIARSSSGIASGLQSNTGPVVYVPFALDAVAGSTGPASCSASTCPSFNVVTPSNGTVAVTPSPTAITQADNFSLANLQTLYGCSPVTVNGVTYDPTGATGTKIDLYIPQAGSGTRSFWASTLNFNATTPPSCVHDHIVGGPLAADNVQVEEHDGTAVASDPNGFGPFSIAQWIAQRNGHNDRRHSAALHSLIGTGGTTPVSPFSNGNPATGSLNVNFPITRDVYSVVSYARVTNSSDPLFGLLNGPNSFTCTDSLQIISYGFGLIPSTCGEVVPSLRALG